MPASNIKPIRGVKPGTIFEYKDETYFKLGDEWEGNDSNLVANLGTGVTRWMRWNSKVEVFPNAEIELNDS